jgi:hypothetical protein
MPESGSVTHTLFHSIKKLKFFVKTSVFPGMDMKSAEACIYAEEEEQQLVSSHQEKPECSPTPDGICSSLRHVCLPSPFTHNIQNRPYLLLQM